MTSNANNTTAAQASNGPAALSAFSPHGRAARLLRRAPRLILRPLLLHPAIFTWLCLMMAAAPLSYMAATGPSILKVSLLALLQGAVPAYIVAAALSAIRRRRTLLWCTAGAAIVGALLAFTEVGTMFLTGMSATADSVNLMLETNSGETRNFLRQYLTWRALAGIALFYLGSAAVAAGIGILGWVARGKKRPAFLHRSSVKAVSALVVAALLIFGSVRICTLMRGATIDNFDNYLVWKGYTDLRHPELSRELQLRFGDIPSKYANIARELQLQNGQFDDWDQGQHFYLTTPVPILDAEPFNIVVIIGESFIRAHSNLYGYPLPTNPRLTAEADSGRLVAFADMATTANFTTTSLRNLLNISNGRVSNGWPDGTYWPAILKRAGWKVGYFDNQTASTGSDYGLSRMLYAPVLMENVYDAVADSTTRYDGDFVDYVHNTCLPRLAEGPKLVLYHLWGQHFRAAERFPGTPRFTAADITASAPWIDDRARREIADYDSATYYNDSVVGAILDRWRDTPTMVVYLSDHGEDIADLAPVQARNLQQPDDPEWIDRQFGVPFFVWMSDPLLDSRPEMARRIAQANTRRGSLADLGQMILGAAQVSSSLYEPTLDIASERFEPRRRISSQGFAAEPRPAQVPDERVSERVGATSRKSANIGR